MTSNNRSNKGASPIENRPGLDQLAYRIGDYGSFKQRLVAALTTALQPPVGIPGEAPLAKLTTRDDNDPAIALLDAWAVVADVLTFYQERIANEGFLRTATERLSVLELARAIGYELDPGVAASTYLSFQVEEAPGSPTVVPIPEHTQIMSVPVKDELPQIFETIEPFTAYLEWNGLRPRPTRPQRIYPYTRQLYLAGTSTQLQAGDLLLLVDDVPERTTYLLPLHTVTPNTTEDYTLVQWRQSVPQIDRPLRRPQIFAFRLQAHLFGYNAPNWETMPAEVKLAAIEKGGGTIQDGVFRSTSDGLLWTPASQGLPDQDITCLAVKQGPDGNPIIFAGTPEKGVFRSTDNGQSWKAVNSGLINPKIQAFCVDDKDDAVYTGTPGGNVFRSKDQGENWVPINQGNVRVEGSNDTNWQSINTSLPNTLVRSLLAYTTETNEGTGTIFSNGTTVTGVGTAFLTELRSSDIIATSTLGGPTARIASVELNNRLTLQEQFNGFSQDSRFRARSTLVSRWIIDNISQKVETTLRELLPSETSVPEFSTADAITFALLEENITMESGAANITVDITSSTIPNPTQRYPIVLNDLELGVLFNEISIDGRSLAASNIGFVLQNLQQTEFTLDTITSRTVEITISSESRQLSEIISDSEISIDQEFEEDILFENQDFSITITVTIQSQAVIQPEEELNGSTLSLEETYTLRQNFQIPEAPPSPEVPPSPDSSEPPSTETPIPQPATLNLYIQPLLPDSFNIEKSTGTITVSSIQVTGKQTYFRDLRRTPRTLPEVVDQNITLTVEERGFLNPIDVVRITSDTNLEISEVLRSNIPSGSTFFLLDPAASPIKRHYIFVGTDEGLYRSHNYGKDWFLRGLANQAILALDYLEPENSDEDDGYIFVGTPFGLHRLANHGAGAAEILLGAANPTDDNPIVIQSLVVADSYIFAGTTVGLYYSSDGGNSWSNPSALPDSSVFSLIRYPRGGTTYTLAATSTGLYRKTDDSPTWQRIGQNELPPTIPLALAVAADKSVYLGHRFGAFLPTVAEVESVPGEEVALEPQSPATLKTEWPNFVIQDPRQLDLDTLYPQILPESWIVLVDDRDPNDPEEQAEPRYAVRQVPAIVPIDRQDFGLVAKISRLELDVAVNPQDFGLRSSQVLGQSTELPLAVEPLTVTDRQRDIFADPISKDTVYLQTFVQNLKANQVVMVNGKHMRMQLADVGGVLRSRHDWQSLNSGLKNLKINALITDSTPEQTTAQDRPWLAATSEGLYHFIPQTTLWDSVALFRFKAVHSGFLQSNILFIGADLGLYRAEPTDENLFSKLAKVELPIEATITTFHAYSIKSDATINIGSISGITVKTSETDNTDVLSTGTLITVAGQARIVTAKDSDHRTFLINQIFAPALTTPTTFTVSGSIWLAGTDRGLLRSTDTGKTWEYLTELREHHIYSLSHRHLAANRTEILAGTDQGLYFSSNSGQNWNPVKLLESGQNDPAVYALAQQPNLPDVWIGTAQGGFQLGTDPLIDPHVPPQTEPSDSQERPLPSPLQGLRDRRILSLQFQGDTLYAGTDQGIYRSTDRGESWESLDAGLTPSTGRSLLVQNNQLLVGTDQGIFATATEGQRVDPVNWSRSNTGIINSQVLCLTSSADATTILAGTTAGLYRSTSAGRTWAPFDDDLDQANAPGKLKIQVVFNKADRWFVGTPEGVFVYADLPDQPETYRWQLVGGSSLAFPDIRAMAEQGPWLLVGTVNGGLFRLNVNNLDPQTPGRTVAEQRWQPTGLNNTDVQAIAVREEAIYVGTSGEGIFRSRDRGNTWEQITDQRAGRGTLTSDGNQVAWTGFSSGEQLQQGERITAAGQTRTILNIQEQGQTILLTVDEPFRPNLLTKTPFTISTELTNLDIPVLKMPPPSDSGQNNQPILYAGTAGSGVFRSDDGGDRWRQVITNLDDLNIRCLLCEGADTVWVGTATAGVFRSINRGDLWAAATFNLTNTDVRALLLPNASTLLAGGIGILKSEDGLTVKPVQRQDRVYVVKPPQRFEQRSTQQTDQLSNQPPEQPDPQSPPPPRDYRWLLRDKDDFQGLLDTTVEQIFPLLPAAEDDALVSEQAQIKVPPTDQQLPILTLQDPVAYSYDPATVAIAANVVKATHGETAQEILGSGDGTTANQSFALKKPPLTYVPATNARGSDSTLEVRVDDVLWEEVSALYRLQPQDQAYILRIEDDGTTTVTFGDGVKGARPPSGQENITARYRSGIGTDANVAANRLSILKTRPQGIAEVTNALPATGAANRESLAAARTNAPPTARTLGRIVSLQDFQDFAQGFVGIGKAQAVALWDGNTQVVHITLAGAEGAPVPDTSALYQSLVTAIDQSRDPIQQVQVESYERLFFNLEARVLLDDRYQASTVEPQLFTILTAAFAFDQRSFGQAVTSAEVITALQSVKGVVAVDLDALYRVGRSRALNPTLTAQTARYNPDTETIQPAQLLLLSPVGIQLTFVSTL